MSDLSELTFVNRWTLQCHSGNPTDWSAKSYIKQFSTTTLGDLGEKVNLIPENKFVGAYLCFMKDDIMPLQEHEANTGGQSICIKIPRDDIRSRWLKGIAWAITERIFTDPAKNAAVNGLILSPKRGNSILQIWTSAALNPSIEDLVPEIRELDDLILIKAHNDKPKERTFTRPNYGGGGGGRGRGRGRGGHHNHHTNRSRLNAVNGDGAW